VGLGQPALEDLVSGPGNGSGPDGGAPSPAASEFDYAVIGGGILGLSTAMELTRRATGARLVLLEKEESLASHQSGRNSGVIHSGIYYPPGSFKARFARAGNESMVRYCREHGIAHEVCGKLVVATDPQELAPLAALFERGRENGLQVERLDPDAIAELEPHVRCLAGIRVPSTGVADFGAVCRSFAATVATAGGEIVRGAEVERVAKLRGRFEIETAKGTIRARTLVNCAGLFSDRVARMCGADPGARIVPFRGEYYALRPEKRDLVRGLVYPVPDPRFPFLGVHLTRGIDGSVHAGPNAILAFRREGYRWGAISMRDTLEVMAFAGFRRLARRHLRAGVVEARRSLSKKAFVASLQRLVPAITLDDVVRAPAGVRAQALLPDGRLVDDFLIVEGEGAVHVCNAPSPGATASLEIGKAIVARLPIHERLAVAV
jgi:L-2-hydroxyglutarate oxidase